MSAEDDFMRKCRWLLGLMLAVTLLLVPVAAEVRRGTSYQRLLAAVFLAGVRGIQPRPVGFKFHAVLVINSAHLAALAAPDQDRWLPLFWSVDNYKGSQAQN